MVTKVQVAKAVAKDTADQLEVLEAAAQEEVKPAAPVIELSEVEAKRVRAAKEAFDNTIQYLKALRDSQHDAEIQRMFSVSITNAETAYMWAVKAITWRG
tara:strand:- start:188 stop:487 length:300 start_codon:yes stop_codon:yes gene_type:complete